MKSYTRIINRRTLFTVLSAALMCSVCTRVEGFVSPSRTGGSRGVPTTTVHPVDEPLSHRWAPTALQVWWFGGAEGVEVNQGDESCELVAVRIDRTSPNSRRIAGSITIPTKIADVWAILTDYDRLAIHVPNLVESKIVSKPASGEQGDGSYRCKLYQKGAQKIVGFEFGASVTMQMAEKIVNPPSQGEAEGGEERMIGFKCVDSFFFTEFDGDWKAKERLSENGDVETELTYVVDVRPKGPVPVAALEWRIREDVPTNLRAVKKAAIEVGAEGVMSSRNTALTNRSRPKKLTRDSAAAKLGQPQGQTNAIKRATPHRAIKSTPVPAPSRSAERQPVVAQRVGQVKAEARMAAVTAMKSRGNILKVSGQRTKLANQPAKRAPLPFKVNWEADETMAAYLRE